MYLLDNSQPNIYRHSLNAKRHLKLISSYTNISKTCCFSYVNTWQEYMYLNQSLNGNN